MCDYFFSKSILNFCIELLKFQNMNWFFIEFLKNKGKLINIKFHSKWFRVIKYVLCYEYLKFHSYMEAFIEKL
jgi:hypothetical protein